MKIKPATGASIRKIPSTDLKSLFLNLLFDGKLIVNCEGRPYLARWFLWKGDRMGVFLHRFLKSDEDRALHDHPWDFIVIPLWKGYTEYSLAGPKRVRPLIGTRYRKATYRHRVELLEGKQAWSILIRFRYRRVWGFWPSGRFTSWKKWWSDLCED